MRERYATISQSAPTFSQKAYAHLQSLICPEKASFFQELYFEGYSYYLIVPQMLSFSESYPTMERVHIELPEETYFFRTGPYGSTLITEMFKQAVEEAQLEGFEFHLKYDSEAP